MMLTPLSQVGPALVQLMLMMLLPWPVLGVDAHDAATIA